MVMMKQAFWLILFLAVVGIAALIAAAMMWQKESIQQPGTPTGQRSYQEEYSAPDFTESAGFAVTMYPSTDILIPSRFWLINRKTAEIEYNVIPAGDVRLRVAQTGQLDVPDVPYRRAGRTRAGILHSQGFRKTAARSPQSPPGRPEMQ